MMLQLGKKTTKISFIIMVIDSISKCSRAIVNIR